MEEGGEPACFLDRVCPECGKVRESAAVPVCEHCGARLERDRDAEGRPRNARPRDGLGRPLPYGAEGVRRQPEGVSRSPHEALAEAQRLIDAGMPFHAHEVLEDRWKAAPPPERALWRGLAQFAVGLTHAARGNDTGAAALLSRAAEGIAPYADSAPYEIDVAGLVRWGREQASGLVSRSRGPLTPPRLRATDR